MRTGGPAAPGLESLTRCSTLLRVTLAALRPAPPPRGGPLVSVVIATYNWSSVLRLAIESVLDQTYESWELIVVGDGCTDDSEQVVASFRDPRIRWLGLTQNSGSQSAPNNAGIAAARGTYVAYLGHDDLWFPGHLARLVGTAARSGAEVVFGIGCQIGPPGSNILWLLPLGSFEPDLGVNPSTLMHMRSLVEQSGGWRDFRNLTAAPDIEFAGRIVDAAGAWARSTALTTAKFNSALRPNSYVERRCDEQEAMLARIRSAPRRTALRLLTVYAWLKLRRARERAPGRTPPPDAPPGWLVHEWRRVRGLPRL